jgi:hypothetical protein
MDTGNLGRGAMIAGISGALLFIFMFFSWYGAPGEIEQAVEQAQQAAEALGVDAPIVEEADTSVNAWEAFDFTDLVLLLAVLVSVGLAVMALAGASSGLPIAGSALTCGIGALAFLFVLFRTIDPPADGAEREIGLWLGLLATAGIAVGGYLGMQEEGTSFGEEADRLRSE